MPEMHFLHLILGPKPLQLNTKSQGKRCNANYAYVMAYGGMLRPKEAPRVLGGFRYIEG